jgi:hypothetical protein
MSALVVGAIDEQPGWSRRPHFPEGDFLFAQHVALKRDGEGVGKPLWIAGGGREAFCSDAGVRPMRIDSELILSALRGHNRDGFGALPIHDALIAPSHSINRAAEKMVEAFEIRLGHVNRCQIKIKRKTVLLRVAVQRDDATDRDLEPDNVLRGRFRRLSKAISENPFCNGNR